jgi:para-aminobenzoate synthetase/4-amino-4-deoxychorismate lyase
MVFLESHASGNNRSFRFCGLQEEISANTLTQVIPALQKVEACLAQGFHAAGFLSYEAAAAFDSDLVTLPPGDFPLLWFGIFAERRAVPFAYARGKNVAEPSNHNLSNWDSSISRADYDKAIDRIKGYIAAGETYQVNFTLRQRFSFSGCEKSFYRELCSSQRAPYCTFLELNRYSVLSTSPELFFKLKDGILTTRPMKGTAKRGRWVDEDAALLAEFKGDAKERAENLMIVDLLRNDMGRVSGIGSVKVDSLFDVEQLETVYQMTSTITSQLRPGTTMVELFQALFPCGSVTGAPKKRTMEIIAELEDSPRGLYTGCIGYLSPGREAVFSVAIRTVVIDRETGQGELGLGSGVTWDSVADREYEECLAKGRFVLRRIPEFKLLESLLFEEGSGYFLLERHLKRLCHSAAYFGFRLGVETISNILEKRAVALQGSHKVRLLLSRTGAFSIECKPISGESEQELPTITYAEARVDSSNPFLYHKTDNRAFYTTELAKKPGCADVIFLNENNEVTEGAKHNIVLRVKGELVTPGLESGLLPGTLREELLAVGEIREETITKRDLEQAEEIYLINSVRRWRKVRLLQEPQSPGKRRML